MIDDKLLNAYVGELEAMRVHGRELAQAYPDIAARLDIGPRRSRDPHVERIVESSAFLAARLRMMIDSRAAELPMTLLSMLAPTLIEPVPSMALVELQGGTEQQVVPRGAKFDYQVEGQAMICFSTTMEVVAAPLSLRLRRFNPPGNFADGIGVRLNGKPPATLTLCLGNNELSGATLVDALSESLGGIQVVQPNGDETMIAPNQIRFHGFTPREAALPIRSSSHQAHRLLVEFMAFPGKFRFVSLQGAPLTNGTEVRFLFSRHIALPDVLVPGLITVNRMPVINLWPASATPFEVTGNQLDYPVRVDTQRYRIVECHSVENVDMYGPDNDKAVRLDPLLAFGEVNDTAIRWGTRRTVSRTGNDVMLYFKGLDYQMLGQHRLLMAPLVLASNGELASRARARERLHPAEGLGDWRVAVATPPSPYRAPMIDTEAMSTLIGYLRSNVSSLTNAAGQGSLQHYLRQFPGSGEASWINAIGGVMARPMATLRHGYPQPGLGIFIGFDPARARTASRYLVKRVLTELYDSQRSLNRVEDVVMVAIE